MVEPERVLHSVMVIAFERKGKIDPNLKIIKAVQEELNLGEDEKNDALEHIQKFRGDGDWSGKKDAVISVAISRVEESINDELIKNSSIINAIKKLIDVTINEQKTTTDPLDAFEEDDEEIPDTGLKFGFDEEDDEEDDEEILVETVELESEKEFEEVDDDVDPFELIGGRESSNSENNENGYKDPLEELMDEVDDDEDLTGTIDLDEENNEEIQSETKETKSETQIIEMYRMMLDTVWVDDVIDPSEVALLARKRKELDISFEIHMQLVREMLEDSD